MLKRKGDTRCKKTLKLTGLLFTLILAVSVVFTGCGNGRKDSTTKGTTENNNASGTTEDNLVDDAEDAVDDVADGVGDAVDDIANGFDNYDDAHDYLLNRLQNDDKDGKYEVRNETKDEQEYKDGASGYHFEIYDTSDDSGKKYGDFYVDKDTGKIYKRNTKTESVDNVDNYLFTSEFPIESTFPAPIVINRSFFLQFSKINFSMSSNSLI